MGTTQRLVIATAAGPSLLVVLLMTLSQVGCPRHPPTPAPVSPDASDAATPAPIVNPEPGPVPAGNPQRCATACEHADYVCPGALSTCKRACARAGGADTKLIPCINSAFNCDMLKRCDQLARAAR